jgi:hypothetical protein
VFQSDENIPMNEVLRSVVQTVCLLCGLLALPAFSAELAPASAETPQAGGAETNEAAAVGAVDDTIARVGDQEITFSELNTMLNSSAVVGVSIPALGTPERDTVRITLLDKVVSANLIYLDALQQGLDQDPAYRQKLDRFTDGILIALYRDRLLSEDIQVSEAEIQAHYEANILPGTELTDELRSVIEAAIRRDKIREQQGTLRARLREGVTIQLNESAFDPLQDAERADAAVLATVDGVELRWGEVKDKLGQAVSSTSGEDRRQAVNALIDKRILLDKARAAGLEQDPAFRRRFNEYHKTRLINLHRENLAGRFEPSDGELRAYYETNRDEIM